MREHTNWAKLVLRLQAITCALYWPDHAAGRKSAGQDSLVAAHPCGNAGGLVRKGGTDGRRCRCVCLCVHPFMRAFAFSAQGEHGCALLVPRLVSVSGVIPPTIASQLGGGQQVTWSWRAGAPMGDHISSSSSSCVCVCVCVCVHAQCFTGASSLFEVLDAHAKGWEQG
jgi:hypothetical protein